MSEHSRSWPLFHRFEKDGRYYVADLVAFQGAEVDPLIWEILGLCGSLTEAEMVQQLEGQYAREEIADALFALSSLTGEEFLFQKESGLPQVSHGEIPKVGEEDARPKVFVAGNRLHSPLRGLFFALQNKVHLFFPPTGQMEHPVHNKANEPKDSALLPPWGDPFSLIRFNLRGFSGILLQETSQLKALTLLEHLEAPVFVPIWSASAREEVLFEISLWYSAMRDFDAFLVPNEAVRRFYLELFLDESLFQVLPPGVDCQRFCPFEKKAAKRQIAELMVDSRLLESPIVGFIGPFSPERGASLFLRLAEAHSEFLFLVIARDLGSFYRQQIPDNLLLCDFYSEAEVLLLFQALDLACFFPLTWEGIEFSTLLQTMACGVVPIAFLLGGIEEFIGEAGIMIEVSPQPEEIDLSEHLASVSAQLKRCLLDEALQRRLSAGARQQACRFSWESVSETFIKLLAKCNPQKIAQRKHPMPHFLTCFLPDIDACERETAGSLVLNQTLCGQSPLNTELIRLGVLEGLALTLLRQHHLREVESILRGIGYPLSQIGPPLKRVKAFLNRFA